MNHYKDPVQPKKHTNVCAPRLNALETQHPTYSILAKNAQPHPSHKETAASYKVTIKATKGKETPGHGHRLEGPQKRHDNQMQGGDWEQKKDAGGKI